MHGRELGGVLTKFGDRRLISRKAWAQLWTWRGWIRASLGGGTWVGNKEGTLP